MEKRGQGALEYLLLIGGAVLIAAIVIVILTTLGTGGSQNIASNRYNTAFNKLYHTTA